MNIFIPLGGKGERFAKEGYAKPKALIDIFNKSMIETVIDHLSFESEDKLFIFYIHSLNDFGFSEILSKKYPKINLIPIQNQTKGAAETLFVGIEHIYKYGLEHHGKTIVLDCDTIYTSDILRTFRNCTKNMVFYTHKTNEPPIYSYIKMKIDDQTVDAIVEKNKISDNANTGAYAFQSMDELYKYCLRVVDEKVFVNNEPYTSCVISLMLKNGFQFMGSEIRNSEVYSVGTPKELKNYISNTYAFLFDLDGTLVITDEIYYDVWYEILLDYNITLTMPIFKSYIQGNNDQYVAKTLLSNSKIELGELSLLKNVLFLKYIEKIKIIDGVSDLFEYIWERGHKISIVTNCNRTVAESIVDYIGINKYVDFIVANGDCKMAKPSPDPYLTAMKKYNVESDRCFIFEDSKTGLLSGKSARPRCLVGIDTIYSKTELENVGVDLCVLSSYLNFDMDFLLNYNNMSLSKIKKYILDSVPLDLEKVEIDTTKLKGGYIADVNRVTLYDTNGEKINAVLKLENKNETDLSKMACLLDLYEREYYFYDKISKYANIKTPKYLGLVKDENYNNVGVLLENLLESGNYEINLNLNKENINISLSIVDKMAKFHSKFWNKPVKRAFPELKNTMDATFCPMWSNFINERWCTFKDKWKNILNASQMERGEQIVNEFSAIQRRLSEGHTTIIHGDIKSPNIFYNLDNNYEPVFLDWQHIAIGKGAQDLIFFIIESFDLEVIPQIYPIFKNYYYRKLMENNVQNYSYDEYEKDLIDAVQYVPFFTAVWFGTVPHDDLIDKNFPYFFIQKLFSLL